MSGEGTRYVAFLRGINVGGRNQVAMPRLRTLAEGLGHTGVSTYINSGNLLFDATGSAGATGAGQLGEGLQRALGDELGLSIDVAVRSVEQLRAVLAANPYPDGDPSRVTVAFLTGPAPAGAEDRVTAVATEHERFTFSGSEVWVDYADGLARSRLAAQFPKVVGVSATVRNVRTVAAVLARAD